MAKRTLVGRSSRTPVKHYLLDKAIGKVAGVLSVDSSSVPCSASYLNPMICVDLCGGDGLQTDDNDASPMIMYKHCEWLCRRGKRATLHVIEKAPNTFECLRANCEYMSKSITTLEMGDAKNYRLPELRNDQAAFIHCDPNTVNHIPLSREFVSGFNRYTTYLVTLGCNAGGLKRDVGSKSEEWFDYVRMLVEVLPKHHDAILFWLNRDDSQWAYILSIPSVWACQFSEKAVSDTSKMWTKGVSAISYRRYPIRFHDQLCRLFLTKEQYAKR